MLRLFAILLLLIPVHAFALSSDWARDDAVAVRLISGVDGVGNGVTVPLGLEVQLADGWHTYWRSPGEAGLPPQLDWSRSQSDAGNLQGATLLFPAPQRYSAYGLETIGYRDHVLFPIDATLRIPGQALSADVSLDLLICSSICVPKHFDLKFDVPAGPATPSAEASLLQQARTRLPTDGDSAGILLKSIANDGQNLTFSIASRDALVQPDVFVEDTHNIGFGAPQVSIDPLGHAASLTVKPVDTMPAGLPLAGMHLTLTFINGDSATEIKTIAPFATPHSNAPPVMPLSFGAALLFALLGGLILNLMPCVLPVLSLKILSVARHGGGAKNLVRQSFVTSAAGILFSFLVLAGITALLKSFGHALGWGVQFQQPAFLMLLVLVLTFFAANLWGLFEIPLPRWLADTIEEASDDERDEAEEKSKPEEGEALEKSGKAAFTPEIQGPYHPKLAADFVTGAFATLLATPCTAPFLGTAVGFALASGYADIFAIFAMLGFGMALPYLAVALVPGVATMLPKPGPWMLHLRRLLGIALAVTALWLVWVLAAQITPPYALTFGLFMAAIVILLALKKRGFKRGLILAGIIEFCVVGLVLGICGSTIFKLAPNVDRMWLAFDQNALDADIAEGKTVFLDVTADWCLTCKANMRFVLSRDEIAERLFRTDIITMQADWTNPDPVISDLLHKYRRYGIPFNVVYGPGAPQGIVLPELLTPAAVLKALDKAAAPDNAPVQ
jgi:suppressor for copper-sensitivity B